MRLLIIITLHQFFNNALNTLNKLQIKIEICSENNKKGGLLKDLLCDSELPILILTVTDIIYCELSILLHD